MQAIANTNPLLESVIQKSFRGAINEIGLPDLSFATFSAEITPYLSVISTSLDENETSIRRFWQSVLRSEVIATEVSDDDGLVLFLRGAVFATGFHLRMTCRQGRWCVESPPAIFERPLRRFNSLRKTLYAAIVVAAGIGGYMVHQPASKITTHVVFVSKAPTATKGGKPVSTVGSSTVSNTTPSTTGGVGAPRAVVLTLQQGMALYSFAQQMQSHHLIKSALSFDMLLSQDQVDTSLKPGTYRFTVGMSDNQLVHVLKSGPSS